MKATLGKLIHLISCLKEKQFSSVSHAGIDKDDLELELN